MTPTPRPPVPPFDSDATHRKVLAAEAAWNSRDPERVAAAYSADSVWRNRDEFIRGRDEIVGFLRRKWNASRISWRAGRGSIGARRPTGAS